MKILWLCQYPIDTLTGDVSLPKRHPSSWIVNLSNAISKIKNVELHILSSCPRIHEDRTFCANNINFHFIKYSMPFTKRGFPYFLPYDSLTWYKGFIKKGMKVIRKINPDLIHSHGTEKGYALLAIKSKYLNITSIQGIITLINEVSPSFKFIAQIPIEKFCIKNINNFGYRTNFDKKFIESNNVNAKLHYMPEMINSVFFEKSWQPLNNQTVVFVGDIIKRKGIEILFNAIKKVKNTIGNINLKLIGNVTRKYYNYLKLKSEKLNISDNIQFLGFMESKDVAEILSRSSIFILPTLIDNSPNSLAEAMAVGMPCIASDVGGIPSMISNNEDGVIFPAKNINALAEQIIKVFLDNRFMEKISNNAKRRAFQRNYEEVVIKQIMKVYKEVLQNGD